MRIQMVCFQVKTLQQQESSCDLDKVFIKWFALKSRICKIMNIEYILIVILIQPQSLFIWFSYFGDDFYGVSFLVWTGQA